MPNTALITTTSNLTGDAAALVFLRCWIDLTKEANYVPDLQTNVGAENFAFRIIWQQHRLRKIMPAIMDREVHKPLVERFAEIEKGSVIHVGEAITLQITKFMPNDPEKPIFPAPSGTLYPIGRRHINFTLSRLDGATSLSITESFAAPNRWYKKGEPRIELQEEYVYTGAPFGPQREATRTLFRSILENPDNPDITDLPFKRVRLRQTAASRNL